MIDWTHTYYRIDFWLKNLRPQPWMIMAHVSKYYSRLTRIVEARGFQRLASRYLSATYNTVVCEVVGQADLIRRCWHAFNVRRLVCIQYYIRIYHSKLLHWTWRKRKRNVWYESWKRALNGPENFHNSKRIIAETLRRCTEVAFFIFARSLAKLYYINKRQVAMNS